MREGIDGSYDAVRRHAAGWRRARRRDVVDAPTFIPLLFCPGEPCQFDWSHEDVEIAGKPDGEIVADHPRCFGRDRTIYDPWHYLPLLVTKPGALPNGAPIRTGNCRRLCHDCGASWAQAMTPDRRFVRVLSAVLDDDRAKICI